MQAAVANAAAGAEDDAPRPDARRPPVNRPNHEDRDGKNAGNERDEDYRDDEVAHVALELLPDYILTTKSRPKQRRNSPIVLRKRVTTARTKAPVRFVQQLVLRLGYMAQNTPTKSPRTSIEIGMMWSSTRCPRPNSPDVGSNHSR